MEKLILLRDDPNAPKLGRIADLLGVDHELVREIPKHPSCMILPGRHFDEKQAAIKQLPHSVLVYDAGSSRTFSEQLKPYCHPSVTIKVSRARPDVTTILSGLSLRTTTAETVFSSCSDFDPLFTVDNHGVFLSKGRFFLLGSSEVLDIETIAESDCEPCREHFIRLMPFAMFIKWVFKERCWHLPTYYACIIIDDPLLRRRYGFIDFSKFLAWLRANDLAATFAFIPWNHSRSDPITTSMFKANSDRLSICVHGCDHTGGEFGITDAPRLEAKAKTAITRMARHEKKYGLTYDRVMVFPQGKFSKEALTALMRNGYVAAVNTSVFPTDYDSSLKVRDLLELAVVLPYGVPLYRRRYPVELFDVACDIFFEKPVFIVQHHQDFRSGFEILLSFIQRLHEIKPDIKWMPIGTVLAQSFWKKVENNGSLSVRKLAHEVQEGSCVEMDYGLKERARVALRRYLSEFRDNHIDRSRILTSVTKDFQK